VIATLILIAAAGIFTSLQIDRRIVEVLLSQGSAGSILNSQASLMAVLNGDMRESELRQQTSKQKVLKDYRRIYLMSCWVAERGQSAI
jgi:hypothetical protein